MYIHVGTRHLPKRVAILARTTQLSGLSLCVCVCVCDYTQCTQTWRWRGRPLTMVLFLVLILYSLAIARLPTRYATHPPTISSVHLVSRKSLRYICIYYKLYIIYTFTLKKYMYSIYMLHDCACVSHVQLYICIMFSWIIPTPLTHTHAHAHTHNHTHSYGATYPSSLTLQCSIQAALLLAIGIRRESSCGSV